MIFIKCFQAQIFGKQLMFMRHSTHNTLSCRDGGLIEVNAEFLFVLRASWLICCHRLKSLQSMILTPQTLRVTSNFNLSCYSLIRLSLVLERKSLETLMPFWPILFKTWNWNGCVRSDLTNHEQSTKSRPCPLSSWNILKVEMCWPDNTFY